MLEWTHKIGQQATRAGEIIRRIERDTGRPIAILLDLQGPTMLLWFKNPFFYMPQLGFFLQMLPYALVIVILVIGSREALKRIWPLGR